ncbi:MAG: trimethylamine methyltransferase family protein [Promethearchaeota archaeon]
MKLNKFKVLSNEEIERIHETSMRLLSEVGIKIDSMEVLEFLKQFNVEIDSKTLFVKFSESLIKKYLKKVPSNFKLHYREGTKYLDISPTSTHFLTIGAAVKIHDPTKKKLVRKSVLADTINFMRVVNQLENISASQIDIWPGDIKYTTIHAACMYHWAKNSHKPFGFGCYGKVVSQDSMNMASIIAGGEEKLKKKPRIFGIFNPTSPLHLPKIMTNGLEIYAKYNQPLIIAPEALGGTSAPITLAGLVAQTNAEILGAILLAQLYNPGTPVFYGTVSHTTDMRTGNSAIGAIETGLITTAMAQMAQFYKIPSRSLGGVTDSKALDMQNGIERFQTLLFATQSGINFITCAGTYEATLAGALELLPIDNELMGMALRAAEGIKVDEETLAFDIIKRVATSSAKGKIFLNEIHTSKHFRKELYMPSLADRTRRTTWYKKGAKTLIDVAKEKVEKLLASFKEYTLPREIDQELQNYLEEVDKRSFEYYVKQEGISQGGVTLPNGKELSI